MKKFLAVFLSAALVAGLAAGCGSDSSDSGSDESVKTAEVIDVDLTEEEYAFGVDKTQPELLEQVNAFIQKIKEDGTLDEICDKYFGGGEPTPVESAELDPSKEQLVVATNAAFEPFEFMQGENYVGIDMELAAMLADELGQELVIQNMDFDAVCLSVGQQKCDLAMAGLTVSEDRKEYVTFSESYYQAPQRLVVPSDDTKFADMTDADSIAAALAELDSSVKIGVQQGTTGQAYVQGSDGLGFPGLNASCQSYKNGSLAITDMLNGNIDYVIIDAAPAAAITKAINEMR